MPSFLLLSSFCIELTSLNLFSPLIPALKKRIEYFQFGNVGDFGPAKLRRISFESCRVDTAWEDGLDRNLAAFLHAGSGGQCPSTQSVKIEPVV